MARFARCCALALALAGSAACSDDPTASPQEQNLPSDVSVQVGAKGGTLKAKGMTLEIPEGALDKNLKVSITNAGQTAPKDIRAKQLSDVYEFGPSGTTFKKEVTLTFQNENADERAEVYFTKEDGSGFERIDSDKSGHEVTARVKHFSQGFLGLPLEDELDAGAQPEAGLDAAADASAMDAEPEPEQDADKLPDDDAASDAQLDADTELADAGPDAMSEAGGGADASADGSADASSEAGPPLVHVAVHSRDRFGVLVNQTWAAFQDGQGVWQALSPSATGVYEFDIASSGYGVAFVCSSQDLVNSWGTVSYAPSASSVLDVVTQGPPCTAGAPPKAFTVQGTLNLGSDQYWRMGHAHLGTGINFSTIPVDFTASDVREGELNDLLFASGPSSASYTISRFLVRRDLSPKTNVTGYNLDIVKGGVAALGTAQAQVLNASDATSVDVRYLTRDTEDGLWLNAADTTGSSTRVAAFTTLPESIRRGTDRYFVLAADQTASDWRQASLATYPTGDLSVSLPPTFSTVFSAQPTPYLRPSFDFTPLAGASLYSFSVSYSPQRGSTHLFTIELAPAWLAGAAAATLTFPDFSQVQGFDPSWVAPSGGSVAAKAAVQTKTSNTAGDLKTESGQNAMVSTAAL